MLTAKQLLDDVCSPDPAKVAAALQAARGRGVELAPGLLARITNVLERPEDWTGELYLSSRDLTSYDSIR
jgi:hypothetical protein